uniref:Uncharacterized protein n=1 Tax=Cacopsylla melanoneura TaxID=428564 RepID=A0A8D8T3C5_9HEMI
MCYTHKHSVSKTCLKHVALNPCLKDCFKHVFYVCFKHVLQVFYECVYVSNELMVVYVYCVCKVYVHCVCKVNVINNAILSLFIYFDCKTVGLDQKSTIM